jgi:single-strand DNA-binding protein
MASFNRVILIGNLTRDPQLKYLPSQAAVTEWGMAMNHKYKTASGEQREDVCFVDCVCFGKGGEIVNQYCQKGKPLMVEGRLKYDSWEDKQGGGKRHKLVVVVENFQLLGSRGGNDHGGDDTQDAPPPRKTGKDALKGPPAEKPYGDEQQFKEDDIPF